MKIGLIDVDSHNFPNLPLMKLSAYHKMRGAIVEWANKKEHYDCVYISKIFTSTPDDATCYQADETIKGGTGYSLENKLPDEAEHIYPDYSLYPQFNEAYGFLTRGCPRNCKFCIVSTKEGRCSQHVADLPEFWQGQKEIKLLDPNLLACREREKLLQQLIDSKAYIDVTQGFDIRFTDDITAKMIKSMKIKMLHFAWDNPAEDLRRQLKKFKQYTNFSDRKMEVYILTNFNSANIEDWYRVKTVAELGYRPFVMIYEKGTHNRFLTDLARWSNNPRLYRSCTFEDYIPRKDGKTCRELYHEILNAV